MQLCTNTPLPYLMRVCDHKIWLDFKVNYQFFSVIARPASYLLNRFVYYFLETPAGHLIFLVVVLLVVGIVLKVFIFIHTPVCPSSFIPVTYLFCYSPHAQAFQALNFDQ